MHKTNSNLSKQMPSASTKYIRRSISDEIIDAANDYSVITITGPRQSGKSTLSRHLFPNLPYFSMENPDDREVAVSDPRFFLSRNEKGMIIDEAQRAPQLFSYIQGIVDEHPEKLFLLTGSAQFLMLKSVSQSLAGRSAIFELLPLSINEIHGIDDSYPPIDTLLWNGMYPAIWSGAKRAWRYYQNYTKTYVERDVREIVNVKDLGLFDRFIRLCAARVGSIFVSSEVANELGVSNHTVNAWLGILQASYIVYMLPPFYENIRKRLTKTPKIYFTDSGLLCYLLGIESEEQLKFNRMRGHIFENFVVIEAMKKRLNAGKDCNMFFLRDSNGVEIDLLTKYGEDYKAFEIKSGATYNISFEKWLNSIAQREGDKIKDSAVIYTGDFTATDRNPKILNYKNMVEFM